MNVEERLDVIVQRALRLSEIHDTSSGEFLEALSQLEEALEDDPYIRCSTRGCWTFVGKHGDACAECHVAQAEARAE